MALTVSDVKIIKAMLARGDKQHDIAARFGVNGGRIAEVATGKKFGNVPAAENVVLPPAGPVSRSGADVDLFQYAERKYRSEVILDEFRGLADFIQKLIRRLDEKNG